MTDAEINLAIAKIENPQAVREGTTHVFNVDYVNNWSDIGPIIERESINLFHDENEWSASGIRENGKDTGAEAETPTKAAALCYLKMRESE